MSTCLYNFIVLFWGVGEGGVVMCACVRACVYAGAGRFVTAAVWVSDGVGVT